MPCKSSSAASDGDLARFGLRIIRAMQPSAARGETAECVAERSSRRERLQDERRRPAQLDRTNLDVWERRCPAPASVVC